MGMWFGMVAIVAGLIVAPRLALAQASDSGLVTVASQHGVAETIERFEAAIAAKGWVVFTRIDHAAAAKAAGLELGPRTVVIFGNPKAGTDPMRANPTLAIDLPMKALVWQDDAGKVWLTYNSADYLGSAIYPRHGIAIPPDARKGMADFFAGLAHQATE